MVDHIVALPAFVVDEAVAALGHKLRRPLRMPQQCLNCINHTVMLQEQLLQMLGWRPSQSDNAPVMPGVPTWLVLPEVFGRGLEAPAPPGLPRLRLQDFTRARPEAIAGQSCTGRPQLAVDGTT